MSSDLPVSADALLAERARLEEVLQSSEDWCELLRLKSRKDRGEGMSAVNAARLEMVLIDALAEDPNFVRYKAVCVALERLIRGLPPLPAKNEKPSVEKDDLTEIDGITASMQRRLNALDVMTFMEIAEWTPADVKSISADLGIGRQIYEQDWIGQAEELATRSDEPQPAPSPKPTVVPKQSVPERPAPPPRPVDLPVQKSAPVLREAPAAVVEAKPEPKPAAKPVEPPRAEPAPVSVKDLPPKPAAIEPAKTQAEQSKPSAEPERKPQPTTDPVAGSAGKAKEEHKPASAVAPPTSARTEAIAAPPLAVVDGKPIAEPPRPLKAEVFKPASGETTSSSHSAPAARADSQQAAPLKSAPDAPSSAVTSRDVKPAEPLAPPPRPLVITRASLPPRPKAEIAPTAAVVSQRPPEPPTKTTVPAVQPPAPKLPVTAPAVAASTAPSMSIAEAIAYAAEVARQSPKSPTATNADQSRTSPAQADGSAASSPHQSKSEPTRQPAPPAQPPAQAKPVLAPSKKSVAAPTVTAAPAIPPPLPAGFVLPPEEAVEPGYAEHQGSRVQSSRLSDRDDRADQRAGAEEATVEIVIKSAPELRATPRVALTKVATETTANTQRPATPIGRFLKALTGN